LLIKKKRAFHKEENGKLTAYFKEILADYDEERVYPSDIKKNQIGTICCKQKG
jgi:hypothetical protein